MATKYLREFILNSAEVESTEQWLYAARAFFKINHDINITCAGGRILGNRAKQIRMTHTKLRQTRAVGSQKFEGLVTAHGRYA